MSDLHRRLLRLSLERLKLVEQQRELLHQKPVYRTATVQQAEHELTSFEQQWGAKYRSIVKLWREHWENIIPFFAFPPEVRKVIYTTNAVEALHMSLRKVIKARGSFPHKRTP